MNIRRLFGTRWQHSTRTTGTTPVVNGKPISFEVWLDPSPAPWSYVPTQQDGPFRLVRSIPETNSLTGYAESTDLTELVELFAKFHLPRRGQLCTILDGQANVILGWAHSGGSTYWGGCQHGYALFGCFMPFEAAVAEQRAVSASVLDIGEVFHHELD